MKNIILKLLKSTNEDDILIAISLIAELEDPRAFFRDNGEILPGQVDENCEYLGTRYRIDVKNSVTEQFYYKIKEDYYIVRAEATFHISECYRNYNKKVKVINHEH